MGSIITLEIEGIEIFSWKNGVGIDCSNLFVMPDDVEIKVNRDYDEDYSMKCSSRKLASIKNRLNLSGYSLPEIKAEYDKSVVLFCEENNCEITLPFEKYAEIIKAIDFKQLTNIEINYDYDDSSFSAYIKAAILNNYKDSQSFPIKILYKLEELEEYSTTDDEWREFLKSNHSDCKVFADFLRTLDDNIALRLLAENTQNKDLEVTWWFGEVVNGGWIKEEDAVHPLSQGYKILIVTEGSTDTNILKKALDHLYPDIYDYFEFIDMKENYPFTGTGNLCNFCLGLNKIKIQNNVIVLFDNDTAGLEQMNKLKSIIQSENILILTMPSMDNFNSFKTQGPQGESTENINGKAVSMECFLDFLSMQFAPQVRWTAYSEKSSQYQGSLIKKDNYTKIFLNTNLSNSNYDCSKLQYLIDYIIEQWGIFCAS